jgi:hypothetical protein
MKRFLVTTLIAGTCLAGMRGLALTINDFGVVGIVNGQAGDTGPQEAMKAQHILDLPAGTLNSLWAVDNHVYSTSATEYSGLINGPGIQSAVGATHVDAGWEYALAKYDGQNAGYVLFFLGGAAADLPGDSASIWLNGQGKGYGISHFTVFDPTPTVPDGGTTVMLLGAALSGLALLRRKLGA